METIPGIIQRPDIIDEISKKLHIEFTVPESDLLLLKMYKQSHNIKKLPYSPLVNFLENICPETPPKVVKKSPPKSNSSNKKSEQHSSEKKKSTTKNTKIQSSKNKESKNIDSEDNYEEEKFDDADIPVKEEYKNAGNGIPTRFPMKKSEKNIEAKPEQEEDKEQNEENYEDDLEFEDDFESEDSESKNQGEEDPESKNEFENMTQEKMIEIAQKTFFNLANSMIQTKTTARKLYANNIKKQTVNGQEVEVISSEDFINGMNALGLKELQSIEYACLIKVLAVNDSGDFIKLEDLVLILEDYGIKEDKENAPKTSIQKEEVGKGKGPDFYNLDKYSMILLLALTEYLIKSNTPLYDLFGDKIHQESIKVKSKQRKVELISSKDFFEVLASIGIQIDEGENEDLKAVLSFSNKQFPNQLSVKKIKSAIEQFAFSDELRKKAHEYYESLVDEQEQLDRDCHETIKEQPE